MKTEVVEEYLEAIYKLEEQGPVRAIRLAEFLNITPASVTEMVAKLAEKKLVSRSRDSKIALTKRGRKAALELVRKHRLSERFLTDVLGIPWDKVHEEACKLEHALSPEVTESLDRLLENPASCPHGHPIPDRDGQIVDEQTMRLSELSPKDRGEIVRVYEENAEILQYLAVLGLLPKVTVEVEEVAPFSGPLLIKVGSARYALGREVASKIMVKGV